MIEPSRRTEINTHPLNFLDVLAGIGPTYDAGPADGATREGLLASMNRFGIAEAAVACLGAAHYAPDALNRTLSDGTKSEPRLHPVWVVSSPAFGDFPPAERLAADMAQGGVRMLRLLVGPARPFSRLKPILLEPLLDEMAERRIPLAIDAAKPDLAVDGGLEDLLAGWPELPVILSFPKVEASADMLIYALWEKGRNLRLELSGVQTLGVVEDICATFDAGRLVYGSRYPYFTQLQGMLQVIYADIPDRARRAIAGDTARMLMEEARL